MAYEWMRDQCAAVVRKKEEERDYLKRSYGTWALMYEKQQTEIDKLKEENYNLKKRINDNFTDSDYDNL